MEERAPLVAIDIAFESDQRAVKRRSVTPLLPPHPHPHPPLNHDLFLLSSVGL